MWSQSHRRHRELPKGANLTSSMGPIQTFYLFSRQFVANIVSEWNIDVAQGLKVTCNSTVHLDSYHKPLKARLWLHWIDLWEGSYPCTLPKWPHSTWKIHFHFIICKSWYKRYIWRITSPLNPISPSPFHVGWGKSSTTTSYITNNL